MAQHNAAVELENLAKTVKKKPLLKPVNYSLSQGNILALCGGNGAGKSTLIRLIIGLLKPSSGSVSIFGQHQKRHSKEALSRVGYMPDDFQFPGKLTAKETLHFYAKLKNIDAERCMETLTEVGLWNQRDEKVHTFSKGMNQRLLFAQALLANPDLLILDEPTNGLDPHWVKQFCELMMSSKKNGKTIIFSTHDLHVAEEIADEVMFLREGKVMSQGAVNQYRDKGLYEAFQELYV